MKAHYVLVGIVAGSGEFSIVCASTDYAPIKAELNAARITQEGAKYDLLQVLLVKGGDFTRKAFKASSSTLVIEQSAVKKVKSKG